MTRVQSALGITLPFQNGQSGYFRQSYDVVTQVKSNLINLLMTKKGERIMQPSFGCDIHSIVFSNITEETHANVRGTIEEAIQIWLPYVAVDSVRVVRDDDKNLIYVAVVFSLTNNLNITDSITLVL